jgi:hypothetical protein
VTSDVTPMTRDKRNAQHFPWLDWRTSDWLTRPADLWLAGPGTTDLCWLDLARGGNVRRILKTKAEYGLGAMNLTIYFVIELLAGLFYRTSLLFWVTTRTISEALS